MPKKRLLILLILFLAFALRTYLLTEIPPGLTHDEANHGREAIGVLDGVLLFYFPLNYGSEPLYSYTVAASMSLFGENLFALRLVNAVFGLAAISMAYAWTRRAFSERIALLAAVLLAVSFWPLASSREALRAGMLPFFMTTAVWFFWQIVQREATKPARFPAWPTLGFGVAVAITLHIYLAARVAWLLFPLFLLYLAVAHRPRWHRTWRPALAGLVLAGLLVIPMFVYLQNHPEALTRLEMLERPLQDLRSGRFVPVLQNAAEALLAFVWPGYGDHFLAYNIPGRPVFDLVSAVFFVAGVGVCLWHWKRPSYAFLLLWFGVGIIPSLITGPTANTTRNLAALTAVYVLPAVGFFSIVDGFRRRRPLPPPVPALIALGWILLTASITARDYFVRWGQSPEVRSAYQHTIVEAFAYLQEVGPSGAPVVISSAYPGPAHDDSIGMVMAPRPDFDRRWVDARYALLFPGDKNSRVLIPESTPPHPLFAQLLRPITAVSLRPDDLDPGFTAYQFDQAQLERWLQNGRQDEAIATFNGAVTLVAACWLSATVSPGKTAELLTIWRVIDPARAGPIVPPAYTTDISLFTHVLDETGGILAQHDALDAPSWSWQAGDVILQIHPLSIPPETAAGIYETAVGIYDKQSGERLAVTGAGAGSDRRTFVTPLNVGNP